MYTGFQRLMQYVEGSHLNINWMDITVLQIVAKRIKLRSDSKRLVRSVLRFTVQVETINVVKNH